MKTAVRGRGGLGVGLFGAGVLLAACTPRGNMTGTATLSSAAVVDACRGALFDADNADPRCLHHGLAAATPPPSALKVGLVSSATARSGYDAGLVLEMKNVTGDALTVDVEDACGTFEAQASNAQATSYESDCFGVCTGGGEPHVLRVTLEPGGTIHKKVKFYAVLTRVMLGEHEECAERAMGPLPPGDYDLRITLPWTDPVPEDPGVNRPRVVESKLTVTP